MDKEKKLSRNNPGKAALRLKAIREESGYSIAKMALEVGRSKSSYVHYENVHKEPFLPYKLAVQFAEALEKKGIDKGRVMALAGAPQPPAGSTSSPTEIPARIAGHDVDAPVGSKLVQVYDVQASAGDGSINDDEIVAYSLAFPPEYLAMLTKSNPKNLAIISVKGESMNPTLSDDDIVMVDTSKTNLNYDGMFVLRFGEALQVKRIGRSESPDKITLISDNKEIYGPTERSLDDLSVIGKVIWYGRKV